MPTSSDSPSGHGPAHHRAVLHGGRLQAFSDGVFAIAVPEARAYRTVVSAQGWHPVSASVDYAPIDAEPQIHLSRSVEQTLG